jgi:transposase
LSRPDWEVYLVNARGTKNLPGRKSDIQECDWLRKLHTYGLLRNSFRPPEEIRAVRTIWRQRDRLVKESARAVQQMQKALTTMNVQLANAISDISGLTGQAIVRAIVAGIRDPWELAKLRDKRIAASEDEIAHSLHGNWREDVLFELQQVIEAYDFYQNQMAACDRELKKYIAEVPSREIIEKHDLPKDASALPSSKSASRSETRRKGQPGFDLATELQRTFGVDLTRIDGIDVITAQVIFSEIGPNFRSFPDENHFASWLTLAPQRDISGGKVIRHIPAAGRQRVANALRMAAPNRFREVTPISVLATVGCGCGWMDQKQSRRWPAILLAWFIAWLPRVRLMWIAVPPITRVSAWKKSVLHCSDGRPPSD